MNHFITLGWIDIAVNVLLVFHVAICLLLCLVVMMQRPKQEGLGAAFGGGMTDQAFGARTTDVLQKGTVFLGTVFFIITFVLAVMIGSAGNDQREERNTEANKAAQMDSDENKKDVGDALEADNSSPAEGDESDKGEPTPTETPESDKPAGEQPEGESPTTPETGATEVEKDAATGAVIGEAAGAIIGKQSGQSVEGAVIGAAIGGVAGQQVDPESSDSPETPETPETEQGQ